jgi:hypothetical protein
MRSWTMAIQVRLRGRGVRSPRANRQAGAESIRRRQHASMARGDSADERVRMPHWHFLRDLVLLELLGDGTAVQRSVVVGRTIIENRWTRAVREQRPLGTDPAQATHLGQRIYETVGQMHADGLLDKPRRGYYLLSADGRRAARSLRGRRSVDSEGAPVRAARHSSRARRPAAVDGLKEERVALGAKRTLPNWVSELKVGRWRPYRTPTDITSATPEPFTWASEDKDAHTQEHADVLTRLDSILRSAGTTAVEGVGRPPCDLAFEARDGTLVIVEAKSLPKGSEPHQMRLGIGQAIEYRAEISDHVGTSPRAILAVPRAPARAALWRRACADAGLELLVVGPATRGLRDALLGRARPNSPPP